LELVEVEPNSVGGGSSRNGKDKGNHADDDTRLGHDGGVAWQAAREEYTYEESEQTERDDGKGDLCVALVGTTGGL
jgi:hypothetical protein